MHLMWYYRNDKVIFCDCTQKRRALFAVSEGFR